MNTILSPSISGTVAEMHYVLGKQFQPGEPLFRIVNTSVVWVLASVPVADIGKISSPRRAEFRVTGMSDKFEVNERNGDFS
jgi:multidrug resistance efflux pump